MNNPTLSADIIENKSVKEYTFGNVVVLTTDIENFRVRLSNRYSEFLINKALTAQKKFFVANNIKTLYPQAVQDYKNSLLNGYPFNPHGAFLNYSVTYNENCVLSFYYDTYTYTGGAHGTTLRLADTYGLNTGREIPLSAYFQDKVNYRKKVLQIILDEADKRNKEDPNLYFDDYRSLIKKYFNEQSYYLTPDGIVIFYGQYEIAPYAVGMPEFLIPYSQIDFPPKCS